MAQFNFDSTQVQASAPRGPLPDDDYNVVITATSLKPTKAGNGTRLEFEFTVTGGQYSGRKVWEALNVDNPSEKAVEIAKADLAAICKAVGVAQMSDTEQLHGIPLVVKVVQDNDSNTPRNKIAGFLPAGAATGFNFGANRGAVAAPAGSNGFAPAPSALTAPAAPPVASKVPWKK